MKLLPSLSMLHPAPRPLAAALAVAGLCAAPSLARAQVQATPDDQELETVTVRADRGRSFTSSTVQVGTFRDQDPLDVPLTNNVVTREVLDAQGARTLFGALRNTAGVTRSQLSGSTYDNISIRGILVENRGNYRLNGSLPIINLIDVPLESKERVEVLKGASSLYYGLVPPSGIVNFVTKRAGSRPVTSVATSVNNHGAVDAHVDIGRRFGTDQSMGLRVNAAAGKEDIGIDNYKGERGLLSLAYDWRVTQAVNLKVDLEHYRKDVSEQAAIALLPAVDGRVPLPPVPDNTRNLAGDWQRYDAEATNAMIRGDISVSDNWILTLEAGRAVTKRDRVYSAFQNYDIETGDGTLRLFLIDGQEYVNTNYRSEVVGQFRTGAVGHELTIGATANKREQSPGRSQVVTRDQNYHDPVGIAPITPSYGAEGASSHIKDKGLYVFDRMSFGEAWQVLVGLRYFDYRSVTSQSTYAAEEVSPNVSVVYKPTPDMMVYGSYLEGLEESGTAPLSLAPPNVITNPGEVLPPAVNKQKELGMKARLWGKLLGQAALFHIDRPQATLVPDDSQANGRRFVLGGRSEYRGVELSVSGEVGRHWAVIASAMFLDAEIKRSSNAGEVGKTPENTPKRTFSLFGEYRVPAVRGWSVNGGLYHVGKRAVNNTNQAHIGSYTTLSLGTRYRTKWNDTPVTLQANIDNLTDREYWSTAGNGLLGGGAPRTLRVAAKFDF